MIVSVVTSKDVGCYYSELWSPFVYESENKTQSVTIDVGFFCRCNCSFVIISILSFRQAIRPTVAAKPSCFRGRIIGVLVQVPSSRRSRGLL